MTNCIPRRKELEELFSLLESEDSSVKSQFKNSQDQNTKNTQKIVALEKLIKATQANIKDVIKKMPGLTGEPLGYVQRELWGFEEELKRQQQERDYLTALNTKVDESVNAYKKRLQELEDELKKYTIELQDPKICGQ
ncbi:hypothetical protein RF11_02552 [Thelohanellus kitauei]|uniref:Uncharacterized protein n=1 Tax=Thelohanellus kitauei TaxID=669202 RepID=A0A0C2MIG6_THEKT|nr:hypothetical protein RF11_02552 [Thelohanellus kitauei]